MNEFYLQNMLDIVGNDALWWRKDDNGYTTDINEAKVFTREEALQRQDLRHSDVPWRKDYIDSKTRLVIDVQNIDREESLAFRDNKEDMSKDNLEPTYISLLTMKQITLELARRWPTFCFGGLLRMDNKKHGKFKLHIQNVGDNFEAQAIADMLRDKAAKNLLEGDVKWMKEH